MAVYSEIAAAQFENVNSMRSYPFEGPELVSRDGMEVPSDVVVDLHMVVPASFGPDSSGVRAVLTERQKYSFL